MPRRRHTRAGAALAAIAFALALPGQAADAFAARAPGSGGAAVSTTTAPATTGKATWYHRFTITEYWPAPESWFVGALAPAPGLSAAHRIDWLYSAMGISMQGEGIGLDGQLYHIAATGDAGWVTSRGKPASFGTTVSASPYWRAGAYWKSRSKRVTFPLAAGGWSDGVGRSYVPIAGVTFAPGPAKALTYYQSIAVDPKVIPLGSRVYIPAYKGDGYGGWFVAQDTGGEIKGRHIDVFRPPPATPATPGLDFTKQLVLVLPPAKTTGAHG
jgi:3D (Asp-Asp-Asp) domain-containing protein